MEEMADIPPTSDHEKGSPPVVTADLKNWIGKGNTADLKNSCWHVFL